MKKQISVLIIIGVLIACRTNQKSLSHTTGLYFKSEHKKCFQVPRNFLAETINFAINPNADTSIKVGNQGTVIHIPKYAFVDQYGKVIKTTVLVKFREYKNAAEMAFSKLPMTYYNGVEELNFNSSGMFSITGFNASKRVNIAAGKRLKVDYFLAKHNENIDFYRLNNDQSNWKLISEIAEFVIEEELPLAEIGQNEEWVDFQEGFEDGDWEEWSEDINWGEEFEDDENRDNSTLLAEGADAGHTYPDVIKGLNIASFGVYNCDQIYRLANRVNIEANYVDENGAVIKEPSVLSLIDLGYNGAFSFDPQNFTCDAKGDNVLLLFSQSGELFLLERGAFSKLNISENGKQTFVMKNVSKTIQSTEDLTVYLGLNL